MSDGLDFFSAFSRLRVSETASAIGVGRCAYCERDKPLFKRGQFTGCEACAPIRMAYRLGSNNFTLSTGDYAIISAEESVFYTNLELGNVARAPTLTGDALYQLCFDLIINPRQSPYLFVHFGKPTETRNFRVNDASGNRPADFIHISGDTSIGRRPSSPIRAWLVRALVQRYPLLSSSDWNKVVTAKADLRQSDRGQQAAALWAEFDEKFLGIFDQLPEPRSIEHRTLEIASHGVHSSRGPGTSEKTRRRQSK